MHQGEPVPGGDPPRRGRPAQNLQRRPLQKAVLNLAYTPRDDLGVYAENILIGKSLFLFGENRSTVIIDGGGVDVVVTVAVAVGVSAPLVGVGYILGPRISGTMVSGAALSWLALALVGRVITEAVAQLVKERDHTRAFE